MNRNRNRDLLFPNPEAAPKAPHFHEVNSAHFPDANFPKPEPPEREPFPVLCGAPRRGAEKNAGAQKWQPEKRLREGGAVHAKLKFK
jgi:hypothetical protein